MTEVECGTVEVIVGLEVESEPSINTYKGIFDINISCNRANANSANYDK